jgi:hypothetical protein
MKSGWMRLWLACFMGVVAFGFLSVQRLEAQVLYGSVVGTVTDQSGASVPGAQVTITNAGTQLTRQATTNSTGNYSITDLPEGNYTLDVTAKGFKVLKKTSIRVVAGSVNEQDAQLQIGAVTQQVTVKGSAAALQTQKTNVHTTISSAAIQNLPLNMYHNYQTLELLTPGTYSLDNLCQNCLPNAIADTPDRSFAINTNGLPQHINTTRVDGSTDVFLWLPDHMVIVPPAATIQEVNVQTANFGVRTGLTAGAATNVITKSGTNQFHGSLYGYLINDRLIAQNTFVHVAHKPKLIQNNDGFTLGGPIIKNKLFFFGNWDGYFQRQDAANQFLIPLADMRNGNFSNYLGAKMFDASGNPINVCTTEGTTVQLQEGMVFDPTTGNPATGQGRCVFSSGGQLNVIPANRMYAGATSFWQLMNAYQPNQNVPFITNQNTGVYAPFNDIRLRKSDWNRNIYTTKVNYNISNRQTLWVKYALQKALLNDGADYGIAGQGAGTGITNDTDTMIALGHTYTLTPNLVLSGHLGFTRLAEFNQTLDFGQDYGQSVLGLVNSNTPISDKRYSGMPGLAFSGFSTLGTDQSWEPMRRHDWQLTMDENATWMHGNHQVAFGFDAAHNHMNHFQPEIVCCPRGFADMYQSGTFINLSGTGFPETLYTASGTPVKYASAPWNSVALFDLGLASDVQNGQQFINATNKDWQMALYIGDTWRATSKLTVNAGLRWEYYPMITRDGVSKFEVYNPATNTLKLGGLGGNPVHLGVTSSKLDFAPRLGLAYRLDRNTVVRGAFGITYDTLPLERPLRGFWPYTIGANNFVALPGVSGNVTQFLPYSTFNPTNNTANNIAGSPATPSGLAAGVPLIAAPTGFSSGAITPPGNVTIGTMAPGAFKRGYVESWNLTVERKLPGDILLNIGYVGNHLVHQFNGVELNAATFGGGSSSEPLFAAFGRTADTYAFQGYLDSHYNSLQVSFQRPMAQGLMFQGSYTYSKAITYMDDEGWEDGLMFNCPPSPSMPRGCQSHNRGDPFFDRPQMFNVGFVYTLPFGTGHKWGSSNRAARDVLGGWQANGLYTAMAGEPLTISGPNFLNTPYTGQTADFVGPLKMIGGTGPGQFWFNPNAFAPVTTTRFGTSGRGLSWLRGPGVGNLDFSIYRHFKITERYDLELEFQSLNLTNTPHFFNPSTSCSLVASGCGGSFGQIFGAYGARRIQLGAQLSF